MRIRFLFAVAMSLPSMMGASASAQSAPALATQLVPFDSPRTLARVRSFLNQQDVIRVGIEAGENNGHQSTAATVVQRLRELGYRRLIQVVYDSEQAVRLETLFPPFRAANGPFQAFAERRLEFLETTYFQSKPQPLLELGLVGATDVLYTADRLNVRRLVAFQPLNWWGRTPYLQIDQVSRIWDGNFPLHGLTNLGFIHRIPSIHDPLDFIETDMAHTPSLAVKAAGLRAMAANRRHDIAAVYGHAIADSRQLLDYVGGLAWAQREDPSAFNRGIVVPVFNEVAISTWARLRTAATVDHNLRDRARFVEVTDADLESSIETIQAGEILVVRVGPVAKSVFDYFMATSTIAPVVEGRNSANIMMLAGTAYLPSRSWEVWHFSAELEEARTSLGEIGWRAILGMITFGSMFRQDDASSRAIGEFLIETRRPDSDISRRFASSRQELDPIRDDKIIRGLLTVIERIELEERENKQPWPAPVVSLRRISCRAMFARTAAL